MALMLISAMPCVRFNARSTVPGAQPNRAGFQNIPLAFIVVITPAEPLAINSAEIGFSRKRNPACAFFVICAETALCSNKERENSTTQCKSFMAGSPSPNNDEFHELIVQRLAVEPVGIRNG